MDQLTMLQLQCLKDLRRQTAENGKYNEAETARRVGVNRSTVSRWMKKSREQGLLLEAGTDFTKKGQAFLLFYDELERDLEEYFSSLGIGVTERSQAVSGIIDSVDPGTIRKMCRKEKKHLRYDKIGENEGMELQRIPYEQLGDFLQTGIYLVDFTIYQQGKDHQSLSMADMGFHKPGCLVYEKERQYLELTVREIQAYTKGGVLLSGHVQMIKYRNSKDTIEELPILDGKIKIPLEAFWFENLSKWEITGQIQLFMTSNVGERRMPESAAELMMRF